MAMSSDAGNLRSSMPLSPLGQYDVLLELALRAPGAAIRLRLVGPIRAHCPRAARRCGGRGRSLWPCETGSSGAGVAWPTAPANGGDQRHEPSDSNLTAFYRRFSDRARLRVEVHLINGKFTVKALVAGRSGMVTFASNAEFSQKTGGGISSARERNSGRGFSPPPAGSCCGLRCASCRNHSGTPWCFWHRCWPGCRADSVLRQDGGEPIGIL